MDWPPKLITDPRTAVSTVKHMNRVKYIRPPIFHNSAEISGIHDMPLNYKSVRNLQFFLSSMINEPTFTASGHFRSRANVTSHYESLLSFRIVEKWTGFPQPIGFSDDFLGIHPWMFHFQKPNCMEHSFQPKWASIAPNVTRTMHAKQNQTYCTHMGWFLVKWSAWLPQGSIEGWSILPCQLISVQTTSHIWATYWCQV